MALVWPGLSCAVDRFGVRDRWSGNLAIADIPLQCSLPVSTMENVTVPRLSVKSVMVATNAGKVGCWWTMETVIALAGEWASAISQGSILLLELPLALQ